MQQHTLHSILHNLRQPLCLLPWLLFAGGISSAPLLAATAAETEADFTGEIDTVISATRIRQPLTESPSSVTIIDRDMISASGFVELADVLRLVPGMQVSYPQGNQLAVIYHGFGDAFPRSMQVLVDGRSIYQPSFADVDWVMLGIELEDIERIEVIRGTNSPLYGSNAVAGVINIITRLPLQDQGTSARISAGEPHARRGMLRHGGSVGRLDYRATLGYQQDTGLRGDLNSTNDGREVSSVSLRGIWHPQPRDEVDIQLGLSGGNLGGGAEPQDDPPAHDKQVTSGYAFLGMTRALDEGAELHWQLYSNQYTSDDNFRDTISHAYGVPDAVVQGLLGVGPNEVAGFGLFDYHGQRVDTELQYTSPASGRLRTVAGAGLRLNRLKSTALTNRNDWIDEQSERIFANFGYQASDQLLLNLGVMGEHSSKFGGYLSPRITANWLFSPDYSIRISHARAKRNPSLVEASFNSLYRLDDGTPYFIDFVSADPHAETLESTELGFIGYWLDRRLLLDAKLFHERLEDVIHFVGDPTYPQAIPALTGVFPVALSTNDGYQMTRGLEFQLKYQSAPRDFITLQAAALKSDILYRNTINPTVLKFANENVTPDYTLSALFSKGLSQGFEVSAGFYRMTRMIWLTDGDRTPGYSRTDVRLARRWHSHGTNMMLEGIVQDVTGEYMTFRRENHFDTRAFLRFSIGLN